MQRWVSPRRRGVSRRSPHGWISARLTEAPSSLPLPSGGDTAGTWPPTTRESPPRPGPHADLGLPAFRLRVFVRAASQVRLRPSLQGSLSPKLPAPHADPLPPQPLTPCSLALGLGRTWGGRGQMRVCTPLPGVPASQIPLFLSSSPNCPDFCCLCLSDLLPRSAAWILGSGPGVDGQSPREKSLQSAHPPALPPGLLLNPLPAAPCCFVHFIRLLQRL